MEANLVIYNSDRSVKIDMATHLPRIVGMKTLQGSGTITSASVGYPNNKLWYIVITNASPSSRYENTPVLRIVDDGYTIKWMNQTGTKIRYGII